MTIATQIITANHPDYKQVWQLRDDVLRKPLGLSLADEDLSAEVDEIIITANSASKVIGCVMLRHSTADIVKLRQMAVANSLQNTGVGSLLVTKAEETAYQKGYKQIVLHARQTAIGFYEKLGYKITSSVFTEVGIPHVVMEKEL